MRGEPKDNEPWTSKKRDGTCRFTSGSCGSDEDVVRRPITFPKLGKPNTWDKRSNRCKVVDESRNGAAKALVIGMPLDLSFAVLVEIYEHLLV